MRTVTLTRTETGDDGTFGHLVTDSGVCLRSGELPWRKNETGRSSIPAGTYECVWALSPSKGWLYYVTKVPRRSDIEIHPANFCGDRALGFRCELDGCIALGTLVGPMNGQKAILYSHQAFLQFNRDLKKSPFELTIVNRY